LRFLAIHKSQGSEFPVVLMPVAMEHFVMLKRNLIYTGITRARKLMVLVGDARAVAMAVKDDSSQERYSKLSEWLAECANPAAGAPGGGGISDEGRE